MKQINFKSKLTKLNYGVTGILTANLLFGSLTTPAHAANFEPIQMELCALANVATGNILDKKIMQDMKTAAAKAPKNLEELLKIGGPLLSKLNQIDRTKSKLDENNQGSGFATLGSVFGYILSVVQNSLETKRSGSLNLNFLPNHGCRRLVNLNNKANKNKVQSANSIYLNDLIWDQNVPTLPAWTADESANEESALRKILPYLQIAGLNLKIDSSGSAIQSKSKVSGSVVVLFPKYFSYPLKDMYTLNDELRMDKFFFDEYNDGALHLLVISFDNLNVTKKQNEILIDDKVHFNIDFAGGANLVFNPGQRSTDTVPYFGNFRGVGKPSHAARISLKPTGLENRSKDSPFLDNLMDNFLTFNLHVKHFEAGVKTVVNPQTQNTEYYPELRLKNSIDAALGSSTGKHSSKKYFMRINVDKQAQGAIDALNNQAHGYIERFYTEIRDSIVQYNKEVSACLENDGNLERCSQDLQSEFDLPN